MEVFMEKYNKGTVQKLDSYFKVEKPCDVQQFLSFKNSSMSGKLRTPKVSMSFLLMFARTLQSYQADGNLQQGMPKCHPTLQILYNWKYIDPPGN